VDVLEVGLETFVVSDHHWGHHNIVQFCGRPENHNHRMLEAWRETVGPNDVVLHLGDLVWTKDGWPHNQLKHLPGKKFLLPGNHDSHKRTDGCGFERIEAPLHVRVGNWELLFSHRPQLPNLHGDWQLNLHGHIHNNHYPSWMLDWIGKTDRQWLNVSVEMVDYTPRRLGQLLEWHPAKFHNGQGGNPGLQGVWAKEKDPERDVKWAK
jgi:calcineurin-like phosphoesterase family protein